MSTFTPANDQENRKYYEQYCQIRQISRQLAKSYKDITVKKQQAQKQLGLLENSVTLFDRDVFRPKMQTHRRRTKKISKNTKTTANPNKKIKQNINDNLHSFRQGVKLDGSKAVDEYSIPQQLKIPELQQNEVD